MTRRPSDTPLNEALILHTILMGRLGGKDRDSERGGQKKEKRGPVIRHLDYI